MTKASHHPTTDSSPLDACQAALAVEQQRVADLKTRLDAARTREARVERRVLSAEPLRHILPGRRAAFPPASWTADGRARESRLRAGSASYRRALDRPVDVAMGRITLDGLAWWVPEHPSMPDRQERVLKHGLPLDSFLQARELSLGGVTIDVGANLGQTSIPRVLLGEARAVYAAEPEEANFACLVRNVLDNNVRGFVLPDQVAIGSREGVVRLARFPGIKSHAVEPIDLQALGAERAARVLDYVEVPVRPLDTWLSGLGVDVDEIRFVKVDTNGFELEVLRGAASVLSRRLAAWQIEIAPDCLRSYGVALATLLAELRSHFSHFIDLGAKVAGGVRVRPIAEIDQALEYLPNVPATHKSPVTDLLLYHASRPDA